MIYLLLILSLFIPVYSSVLSLAVTENDPSTLVEGVSVITGDLYSFEEDRRRRANQDSALFIM